MLGCAWLLSACGGTPETATKNKTFYDWTVATGSAGTTEFEQRYPPLDWAEAAPLPEFIGVSVLRGGVHLSRPKNWIMRDGNNVPGQGLVQYISPNAYSFAVYERPDAPGDLWRDVLNRYEDDVQSLGAKIVGKRVPMATLRGQGRSYTVERSVDAAKGPFISRSREYLLRGEQRVVLVQIVHQGDNLSAVDQELLRALGTLEVL
ncbi:MAG TPA: hypothetical protein VER33_01335 [Polyangiaceae bacterium]|nr:hypothetical protein [Polyangiaceae bacterium]